LFGAHALRVARVNAIDVLRTVLGEFSEASVSAATRDTDRLLSLINPLTKFYWDWLEAEEQKRQPALARPCYHGVTLPSAKPGSLDAVVLRQLECQLKQQILFFPQITAVDPVAEVIWPAVQAALITQSMGETFGFNEEQLAKFTREMEFALRKLLVLQSFVDADAVYLVPRIYAFDYSSVQQATRIELQFLEDKSLAGIRRFHGRLNEIARQQKRPIDDVRLGVEYSTIHGQFCNRLHLTPVATDPLAYDIIDALNMAIPPMLSATRREHAVCHAGIRFTLPAIDALPQETILKLRNHEEVFDKWRRRYGASIEVAAGKSNDEAQFVGEFREASEDHLRPLVEEVQRKLTATQTLRDLVVPGAIASGLMVYTYAITGELSLSAQLSLPGVMATWVGKRWADRYIASRSGGTLLKEVCGYFLPRRD
jgi:hypothetical protein